MFKVISALALIITHAVAFLVATYLMAIEHNNPQSLAFILVFITFVTLPISIIYTAKRF